MYAAMAVGLVVTYRGTGVVNLAYATMAAFPAMAYHLLVTEGTLALPWMVLPAEIDLGGQVAPGRWPSCSRCCVGLLLGRAGPPHRVPAAARRHASHPARGLDRSHRRDPVDRRLPLRRRPSGGPSRSCPTTRSRCSAKACRSTARCCAWPSSPSPSRCGCCWPARAFGLSTRAAAESEKGAVLLGYSPDRLALANTLLASLVGARGRHPAVAHRRRRAVQLLVLRRACARRRPRPAGSSTWAPRSSSPSPSAASRPWSCG